MSEKFPLSQKKGYSVAQVNEFLDLAKAQYLDPANQIMDTNNVRSQRFDLVDNGYSISAVDAAMEKLEDIFAQRELERNLSQIGAEVFRHETQEIVDLLAKRCNRKARKRFQKRRWPNRGYSRRQVDQLCSQVAKYLSGTSPLTAKEVRLSVFKAKRGGYAEHQVDAFIDKTVELIQRQSILS